MRIYPHSVLILLIFINTGEGKKGGPPNAVKVVETLHDSVGVDTPRELERVRAIIVAASR